MTRVDPCNGTVVQGGVSTPGELAWVTYGGAAGCTPGSGASLTGGLPVGTAGAFPVEGLCGKVVVPVVHVL